MQEQVEAVQRMQDYIELHMNEEITLADLSRESWFSPWYSFRLFKDYTNFTPANYIRRLRLSKSALRLRDEKVRVIEVAFDLGFKSVDGYQRAFFREFGCNPSEYAENPTPLYLFTPYGVKFRAVREEKEQMENSKNFFIQIIQKPARKVLIKRGVKASDYFAYCEEVGCDIWGLLLSIKSVSGEPVSMWLPEKYRKPGTSEYVQGVEVDIDYEGEIPSGMDVLELPESKYLMFQGEPFEEIYYIQAIEGLQKVMKSYDPTILGYHWKQEGIRIQLEPVGKRGYIEMMEIEKIE